MRNIKLQFKLRFVILLFAFCVVDVLTGCEKNALEEARRDARHAQVYYERAVKSYRELPGRQKDDKIHLELGRLFYSRGDFEPAVKELSQAASPEAKKFLALAYYRLAKYTDAYEVFNKNSFLQHRKVYNVSPKPPPAPTFVGAKQLGLRKSPITGDNKLSPKAIFLDDESCYYYGLTCEKLNLFDKALGIYKQIAGGEFAGSALERINLIEKQDSLSNIKDVSPDVYKIIASSPSNDEYPQAGALILSVDERIEVTAENTQVSELHYLVKILNERGKEEFSESHIDYDSTYEKVELEYARTIRPDGTFVEVGSRHIRDVSKYLNFPLYSNARVYIISFPEISEGAVIEYKLKVYCSQLVNKKDFVIAYPLQASEPIIKADFELSLSQDKPIRINTINEKYNDFSADLNPKIVQENKRVIYTWHFAKIPQIIPESDMPPDVQINPAVIISTFENWQDIYNWWRGLARDKITPDSIIKNKVKELTENKVSDREKIRAIYNFVAQKIRYVAVEYGQAGYEPHNAADTFRNKYGDCKDKAILLVTMLKEAGFSAWPVLISTREYYNLNEDFPSMLFNHCIAAVSLEGRIIFMDSTAETCSFDDLPADDQDRRVLVIKEDGYKIELIPLYSAGHNLAKQEFAININKDETISGEKTISTFGIYDQSQRHWLLYTPPELIAEVLKKKIQDISIGAALENYNIENLDNMNEPVKLNYTFSGPEYFTAAGALRIMPQLASFDTSLVAKDKRRYAIDFTILDSKQTSFKIVIPDDFVVKYLPESVNEECPWLKFSAQYRRQDNQVIFQQDIESRKNIVTEEEYPDFKIFFEGLAKKVKQRIIFEKVPNDGSEKRHSR
ncbi:MAG: DUF3857 domain-containing protein [Candidatus Omnitrophota bacterium]